MPYYLQYRLAEAESLLRLFLLDVPTRILYLEFSADGQLTFCAASNRVPQLLRSALWNTREPTILTSGTLTAAGDFDHTEQLLGLAAYAPLRHFRAESPFNYRKKCLLYIPARRAAAVPENQYLADQIVRLTAACHGHALVLFTSYRQMRNVYDALGGRLMFPVFQAGRGQNRSIQQFKQSGNGVLFAAGSCWEGIDFPGDMVSLLIIAKLPFPIPDPVSNYERQQYPNLRDYINAEVIPEMQKKLRQGFGRAIRTEQDSCVVAILDERAGIGGKYHDAALAALPTCPTTEKIEDVQQFIREQKRPDYFLLKEEPEMYLMQNHDVWIYVRCANSDPRIAFDRLYDLIDEAAGHGFLVRGTSFDHCSGNTLKDRIGLRSMLDAVENGRIEAVMVRDLEQISRNSYILVGVIEALRQNDVYLITTECDLNAELINSGLERFVGDRFTRASFGKPRFDVRLPLMDQF